jgi:hypothetical protein
VSLSVLVVGVLVWVAVAGGLRITVDLDRRLVGWYRGESLNGCYRHQVAGSPTARLKATLTDPRLWADLRWLVLNSVFGFAVATVALAVTVEVVSLVAMPLWWWAISDPKHQYATLNLGLYTVTSTGWGRSRSASTGQSQGSTAGWHSVTWSELARLRVGDRRPSFVGHRRGRRRTRRGNASAGSLQRPSSVTGSPSLGVVRAGCNHSPTGRSTEGSGRLLVLSRCAAE